MNQAHNQQKSNNKSMKSYRRQDRETKIDSIKTITKTSGEKNNRAKRRNKKK
jgi:hypothetical protein